MREKRIPVFYRAKSTIVYDKEFMKQLSFLFFLLFILTSCKKTAPEPVKEKVKVYVIASTGPYQTGTTVPTLEISGTNIEKVSNVSGTHIIEANYPKGEAQTLTVKANHPDNYIYLEVSKSLNFNSPERILYKIEKGEIKVNFVAY